MQQKCCRAPILLWVKFLDRQKWKCLIIRIPQQELVMPFTSIKSVTMHALDNLKCSDERTMMMLILNVYIHLFLYLYHGSKILFSPVRLIRGYGVAVCIIQASRTHKSSKFWVFLHSSQAFSFFPLICWLAVFRGIMLHPPGGSNSGVNLVK